jgi:hypothetical protein
MYAVIQHRRHAVSRGVPMGPTLKVDNQKKKTNQIAAVVGSEFVLDQVLNVWPMASEPCVGVGSRARSSTATSVKARKWPRTGAAIRCTYSRCAGAKHYRNRRDIVQNYTEIEILDIAG